MGPVELIANTLASVILAGMMFVPFLNVLVGSVVGAGLAGYFGLLSGAAIAIMITAGEVALMQHSTRGERAAGQVSLAAAPRPWGRAINDFADLRHLKRGLVRTRLAWADPERKAA
jgi:hypothetical protein